MLQDLQRRAGNRSTQQFLQRVDPPTGHRIAATAQDEPSEIASTLWIKLRIGGLSGEDVEAVLRLLLVNRDRLAEIREAYRASQHADLYHELRSLLPRDDALRAMEYIEHGRLRAVAKVLIAIDGAGTATEALWRVLPEAYREGDPFGAWESLVSREDLEICRDWSGFGNLDDALADDLSGDDLDKGKALARYGKLRPVDKIRVATRGAGTDMPLLWAGLREANPATIAAEYDEAYGEDIDVVLFDQYTPDGYVRSSGDLSGGDAALARALLGRADNDPQSLSRIVRAAMEGMNEPEQIWNAVEAAKARVGQGGPGADAAQAQLARLTTDVAATSDPLGLDDIGGLSDEEIARLRAMLGVMETGGDIEGGEGLSAEVINDPLVQRLRALGGVDRGTVFDTLLTADRPDIAAFRPGFADRRSPLSRYLIANTTVNSGERGALDTIITGSVYARLRWCRADSVFGDDKEDYAYLLLQKHTDVDQRAELRRALARLERGEDVDTSAGRAMSALREAFNPSEMNKVRDALGHTGLSVLEEAEILEEDVERERSFWIGLSEDLQDERRELLAGRRRAGFDAVLSPSEEAELLATVGRSREALEGYIRTRDSFINYASMVVGMATGALVTAVTGGAAGPAVVAALLRAAAASALARIATEKALRGDQFEVVGDQGARALMLGAVDGVMSVVSAGAATRILSRVTRADVAAAIARGEAMSGLRLAHTALDGSLSGGVGSAVDTMTQEETWKHGVGDGLVRVVNTAAVDSGRGALLSLGTHVATTALGAGARRMRGEEGADTVGGSPELLESAGRGLVDDHPEVELALAPERNDDACALLISRAGRWETAIGHLTAGSGPYAGLSEQARTRLIDALQEHRNGVVTGLHERFGVEGTTIVEQPGASQNPGSDKDLSIGGLDAGARLIEMRTYLDQRYPGWERTYRMGLMIDPERIGAFGQHLSEMSSSVTEAAQMRLTQTSEVLLLARQAAHAEPAQRRQILESIGDATIRSRVEQMSSMTPQQRRAAHDRALVDGDRLSRALAQAETPEERARLAQLLTESQMRANAMTDDAYVSPGAVVGSALGSDLTSLHQHYQDAIDNIAMLTHAVQESGGVLEAMRSYEAFKYISRIAERLDAAGVTDPALPFFLAWSDLNYRVDRGAMGAQPRERVPVPSDPARAYSGGRARYTDYDVPTQGVPDQFLLDNYHRFRQLVDQHLPTLRPQLSDVQGSHAMTPSLPATTGQDQASLSASGSTGGAAGQSVGSAAVEMAEAGAVGASQSGETAANGPVSGLTEPEAGRDFFAIYDADNRMLKATGRLADGGVLELLIRTQTDEGVRGALRGSEGFRMIMEHFGDRVEVVKGSWTYGSNLEMVNRLTAEGNMSLEEAVARTWTAQQAGAYGYVNAEVIPRETYGGPGAYEKVTVHFTR